MESNVKLANHPLHPILVVFPIALFILSFIFDVVHYSTDNGLWATLSFWNMVAGIVGGLAAAVPGLIDYLKLDLTPQARQTATVHLTLNLLIVGAYIVNAFLRYEAVDTAMVRDATVPTVPFILSIFGVVVLCISGWLGGQLVYRHHVGVHEGEPVAR
jgi:uncharacterized membrane protein